MTFSFGKKYTEYTEALIRQWNFSFTAIFAKQILNAPRELNQSKHKIKRTVISVEIADKSCSTKLVQETVFGNTVPWKSKLFRNVTNWSYIMKLFIFSRTQTTVRLQQFEISLPLETYEL